jgi:hypothetical protein
MACLRDNQIEPKKNRSCTHERCLGEREIADLFEFNTDLTVRVGVRGEVIEP